MKPKRKFTNSSLTDEKRDPDDWTTKLDILRTQLEKMGHAISDNDFMIHISHNLPTKYENKVCFLEKDLDNADDPLTLELMMIE